jgi:hypothetical protein
MQGVNHVFRSMLHNVRVGKDWDPIAGVALGNTFVSASTQSASSYRSGLTPLTRQTELKNSHSKVVMRSSNTLKTFVSIGNSNTATQECASTSLGVLWSLPALLTMPSAMTRMSLWRRCERIECRAETLSRL